MNTFRLRAAEHTTEDGAFLALVGHQMLDSLPKDELWNRLVIFESAPGAGKSTLLRLFRPSVLNAVRNLGTQPEYRQLHDRLVELGALSELGPQVLGVLVDCREQYAVIEDLPIEDHLRLRWFFGLMDARLTLLTLRALLRSRGHSFPQDLCKMDFIPRDDSALMVGSEIPTPVELYESARMTEDVLTQALNRLTVLPQEVDGLRTRLETLRHFSAVDVYVKGELLRERIMFMFDDADALAQRQRDALRHDLEHRDLEVGRWIALRLQALSMSELLSYGRTEGRDFSMVRIEEWAKQNRGTVFSHLLDEVANRRVSQAQVGVSNFASVLAGAVADEKEGLSVLESARETAFHAAGKSKLFEGWLDFMEGYGPSMSNLEMAKRWRALAIRIERIKRKPQLALELPLPNSEIKILDDSGVVSAAELFLAAENDLPYYAGERRIKQLSSSNIEQFLGLGGDLFEYFLASSAVSGRHDGISEKTQDQLVRRMSRRRFSSLLSDVPHGTAVQMLVRSIGAFAREQTYRPWASYAPGITGVAMSSEDYRKLRGHKLDPDSVIEPLIDAISSGIAHNVFELRPEVKVKGGQSAVLYLNRALCPVFELPLGYGGFWEHDLETLAAWAISEYQPTAPPAIEDVLQGQMEL